jgi:4-hydroxy-3-methylbut-2-enyl diphosphate reductase
VVLNRDEADVACRYIRGGASADDRAALLARFEHAVSRGFDPDVHLQRIGCANQTTMLSSESLEIGEMFRAAMRDRYGEAAADARFRAFDTICSATQDRQDAVLALLNSQPLDLMVVIGGYNSSNTCNLARICEPELPTYHVAEPDCLLSAQEIRHKPVGAKEERVATGWLPPGGTVAIGLTSGASTPDNIVGEVVRRLDHLTNPSR